MRSKGISYGTGFVSNGALSRVRFDPDEAERELRIIRDDLHCNAVRVLKVLGNRHGDTYPDLPWEPKAAFTALGEYYRG